MYQGVLVVAIVFSIIFPLFFYLFVEYRNVDHYHIHTPLDVPLLKQMLTGYHDSEYIASGFTNGFSLGLVDNPKYKKKKLKFRPATEALRQKILDEVNKGRIIGPFPAKLLPGIMISPAYAIPKPNSTKVRLIFDLSTPKGGSVNDNIKDSAKSVQYCSVLDVALWLMDNDTTHSAYMAKVDLTDAYRMVPVSKQDWVHLGMAVGSDIYIDRSLPMGAASSCQIFQRIGDAIVWLATSPTSNCKIFNYIDDFLIMGSSEDQCKENLNYFLSICSKLRIPVSAHKTIQPTQSITFLGIIINSRQSILSIPEDKLLATQHMLCSFLTRKSSLVKEWQKLLGTLSHISQVVIAGRTYLGSVYGALKGLLSIEKFVKRRTTIEIREDLLVWKSFLSNSVGKSFKMLKVSNDHDFVLATDSCTSIGFGCVWGRKWFGGIWPNNWRLASITLLELYPIYLALHLWKTTFTDKKIKIYTDNFAVVQILNKLYSKDAFIRRLLRPIAEVCMNNNILLTACHVAGADNIGPDLISRARLNKLHERFPELNTHPETIPASLLPENLPHVLV